MGSHKSDIYENKELLNPETIEEKINIKSFINPNFHKYYENYD